MRVGSFELDVPIARGGTGVIWRARHVQQGVTVAIKVLDRVSDPELLRTEVQAVAALDHPGIVLVFDQGVIPPEVAAGTGARLPEGAPWLAMEFASQGSLKEHRGPIGWSGLRTLLLGLLDALAHAHARGVIRRDIKPGNILLGGTDDPRPGARLADFGLAHVADGGIADDAVTGTPAYMAPEQWQGAWRDFGPWTDLYGLGIVAWELATGDPPYVGPVPDLARAHTLGVLPQFANRFRVPDGFVDWLRSMLAPSPASRFRRAADAAWALASLPEIDEDGEDDAFYHHSARSLISSNPTITLDDSLVLAKPTDRPSGVAGPHLPAFPQSWRHAEEAPLPPQLVGVGLALYGLREIRLVGRERERDRLWGALSSALATRSTRVVLLHGAAGNGKSRLAQWVGQRAHELGAATVVRAIHGPTNGPMDGLLPAFSRYFRVMGLSETALAEHLGANPYAPEPERLAAALQGTRKLAPEERWRVLERTLAAMAARRPVYLWLDDLQWGPDALGFLAWFRSRPPIGPVLVVATVQAEALAEQPAVAARVDALDHERIAVGPLDATDRLQLVRGLIGLQGELERRLAERTGGNPLFTVQLVGDWVARGVLVPGKGGFELRAGERAILPDNLHDVWAARVNRLLTDRLAEGRVALEVAAALGQEVHAGEWQAATAGAGAGIPAGLVEALHAARLAVPSEEGWAFAHGMLRESLQRLAQDADRWRAHNEACAVTLAQIDGTSEIRLGRHWYAAGHWARASELLRRGAEGAIGDGGRRALDAVRLADDALQRSGVPDRDPRWGELWLTRARAAQEVNRLDDALRDAQRVATWAKRHRWHSLEPRANVAIGDVFKSRGSLQQAYPVLERAIAGFEAEGDAASAADARVGLAHARILGGDGPAAEGLLAQAKEAFTAVGNPAGLAQVLRFEGDAARIGLRYDEAWDLFREAHALTEQHGDRARAATNLHGMAEMDRLMGRLDRAEAGYREVMRTQDAIGKDSQIPRLNLGLCLTARRDFPAARSGLLELLGELEVQRKPGYQAVAHAALAAATAGCGDWPAFDRHLDEYAELSSQTGMIDIDIASSAETAASLAEHAGERERAARAWELAGTIWEALGELAHAEAAFERRRAVSL